MKVVILKSKVEVDKSISGNVYGMEFILYILKQIISFKIF